MPDNLKSMTLGLNALLTDAYGMEKRASAVLIDFGLEQGHIGALKGDNLLAFYSNIKFALECRFLHYSGGRRLLYVLCRRYGLFGHETETLEAIGASMGVTRERVRQLQNKAIKRLVGGVSSDAVGIMLVLCACRALGIDAMEFLSSRDNSNEAETFDESSGDADEAIEQAKPKDLQKAAFYISAGFDYGTGRGRYRMLMECGSHKKCVEKQDLEGHSDVSMILLALIEGLELLRKPFDVTVYSNTSFGVSSIYKHGLLRPEVPNKSANYELKEKLRCLLYEKGHWISNIADSDVKAKLSELIKGLDAK